MSLPQPECNLGYTESQLRNHFGDGYDDFMQWMNGQTMVICDGRSFNHETRQYEEACGGVSHGPVCYTWDVARYQGPRTPVLD